MPSLRSPRAGRRAEDVHGGSDWVPSATPACGAPSPLDSTTQAPRSHWTQPVRRRSPQPISRGQGNRPHLGPPLQPQPPALCSRLLASSSLPSVSLSAEPRPLGSRREFAGLWVRQNWTRSPILFWACTCGQRGHSVCTSRVQTPARKRPRFWGIYREPGTVPSTSHA